MIANRDLVIAGAGAAGLSAATFAAFEDLDVLVIEELASGGQQLLVAHLENYPGFPGGVSGVELSSRMEEQAVAAGAKITNGSIQSIAAAEDALRVSLDGESEIICRAAIVATGAAPRRLEIKGEEEYRGRGVSTCASCDGPFFAGKRVVVVGGGDSACDEAIFLSSIAAEVLVIHHGPALEAQASLLRRLTETSGVEVRLNTRIAEIHGETMVSGITLASGANTAMETAEGVFVFIGSIPRSAVLPGADLDQEGGILTDAFLATTVRGAYAAGAVRSGSYRQCVAAAGEGALAAHSAAQFIRKGRT